MFETKEMAKALSASRGIRSYDLNSSDEHHAYEQ